jgi:hypothetical protein
MIELHQYIHNLLILLLNNLTICTIMVLYTHKNKSLTHKYEGIQITKPI